MTSEESKAVVKAFLEALWVGDLDTAKAQFSDDSEWWFRPSLGYKRPMSCPEAIDIVTNDMIARFDTEKPFDVEWHHLLGDGSEVAAEYTATATTVSGRAYKHRYLLRASIAGGKIKTVRPWADTKYFLETLYGD